MKRILVIDDDQFFAKTLGEALPPNKYDLMTAEDGEAGFAKIQKEKPDLVVLDLMIPKLDGASLLKKIKESPELGAIPVLVSSNLSSVKKISDCMALGAVGYVIKSDESMQAVVQDIERIFGDGK